MFEVDFEEMSRLPRPSERSSSERRVSNEAMRFSVSGSIGAACVVDVVDGRAVCRSEIVGAGPDSCFASRECADRASRCELRTESSALLSASIAFPVLFSLLSLCWTSSCCCSACRWAYPDLTSSISRVSLASFLSNPSSLSSSLNSSSSCSPSSMIDPSLRLLVETRYDCFFALTRSEKSVSLASTREERKRLRAWSGSMRPRIIPDDAPRPDSSASGEGERAVEV